MNAEGTGVSPVILGHPLAPSPLQAWMNFGALRFFLQLIGRPDRFVDDEAP
jgi:hypothetical protein